MIAIVIVLSALFGLKMLVEFVYARAGMIRVMHINGFLFGFDVEEVTEGWENENKEVIEIHKVHIDIGLGFLLLQFEWQENYEEKE